MDTSALITLDQIVDEILLLSGLPQSKFPQIKQLAIKGYREMNLTTIPEGVRIEKFTMDDNYIIYLNDDIIQVNNVYVPIDGKLWSLTKSTQMVPTVSFSVTEFRDSDDGEGVNFVNKDGVLYAATGGNNTEGYWYYDYANRRILFTNTNRSEVLVDYTTSGVSLDSPTFIPSYAVDAVEHYILWKISLFSGARDAVTRDEHKREYERQKSICRGMQFNFDEFKDTVYGTFFSSFNRI